MFYAVERTSSLFSVRAHLFSLKLTTQTNGKRENNVVFELKMFAIRLIRVIERGQIERTEAQGEGKEFRRLTKSNSIFRSINTMVRGRFFIFVSRVLFDGDRLSKWLEVNHEPYGNRIMRSHFLRRDAKVIWQGAILDISREIAVYNLHTNSR